MLRQKPCLPQISVGKTAVLHAERVSVATSTLTAQKSSAGVLSAVAPSLRGLRLPDARGAAGDDVAGGSVALAREALPRAPLPVAPRDDDDVWTVSRRAGVGQTVAPGRLDFGRVALLWVAVHRDSWGHRGCELAPKLGLLP